MKEIEIKDKSGQTRFTTPANIGVKGKFSLMQEDYIILPFSVKEPVSFKMGDYVDLSETLDESLKDKFGKIYEVVDKQNPVYNSSTGGYDYQLRLDAYYWKWKNKIFRYTPENTASEASWSLTAALDVQLGVFLRNLKALGYTYRGVDFTFSIDSTVEDKAVAMTYDNMNLLDALFSMAGEDKWNCDCWITDNVIHFGRCEFGDAVKIERDVEAALISKTESKGDYGTRIIAFGSTNNIPTNYRKKFIDTISFIQGDLRFTGKLSNTNYYLEQGQRTDIRILTGVDAGKVFNVRWDSGNFYFETGATCNAGVGDKFEVLNYSYKVPDRYLSYGADDILLNGVVQRRLMLPEDTPYIDLYEGMTDDEAIEKIVTFDDVFPRMDGILSDVHTRTEEVENEDGTKETVTYYRYKDENLNFKEEYKLDEKLRIKFQSGLLNGLEFEVLFNPLPKDENRGEQLWEIVLNENYGRRLPDDIMYPASGDKYVLLGFDTRYVSTLYIPAAEQKLKEKTQKYVDLIKNNDGTFPVTLKSTWVYENISLRLYGLGQRINLIDNTYFENGRLSRVLGYEINLDYPWDSPIYTIGESSSYSRIQELEDKVDALVYKGQTYVGTGGSGGINVYIIKSNDSTQPTDLNVFSALKALATLLRKDQADTMPYLLTLLKGAVFGNSAASIDDKGVGRLKEFFVGSKASIDANGLLTAVKAILQNIVLSGDLQSDNFLAGALGTGYALIKRDADGKSYLEVDKLFARVKAIFAVLEIMKVTYTGGNFVFSPAGMTCTKVEEYDGYYRCYFTADDGEKAVENTFEVDDLVQLREFNVKSGVYENVANRYFWRRCIAKGDDYIDLSKTDRDMTSDDAPMAGDALVTIGNKTIKSRQNVIIISVYGEGSPSIVQYQGINSYSLDGKAKTIISPNGNNITGNFILETSGKNVEDEILNVGNESKKYTDSRIEASNEEIKLAVTKWIQGGNNLITNTYNEYTANGTSSSTSGNYITNNWEILPKCAGESIVTAVKVKLSGCTLTSSSKIYVQATNEGGWNYNTLCSNTITSNGEYLITGITTAPYSLYDNCPVRIRFDYIRSGTITISEMRSYVADAIEPVLPWQPSEGDLMGFDSKIEQTAESISLKVQEVVTGVGSNILVNSSFSQNTNGWNNVTNSDITTIGGYKCVRLSPNKFMNQSVRLVKKSVGMKVAISFDIYKPSTLKVINVRLSSGSTVEDTNPISLTSKPNNTWTRVSAVQTIQSESECDIFMFGNRIGGSYSDSTGTYYVKNVKLEYGDTATSWNESSDGLLSDILATGIDILKNKIILTANQTLIQSNDGTQIAMFTTDADGKPLIKGENIDATNIRVKYLETSAERYEQRKDKIVIDAESNTFKMLIKDTSGERNVFDMMFAESQDGTAIAEMVFNKYNGSVQQGKTIINQEAILNMSFNHSSGNMTGQSKLTSDYLLIEDVNPDYPTGNVKGYINISAKDGVSLKEMSKSTVYQGKTQSIYVATNEGQKFINFYMGFFVGLTSTAMFS